MHSMEHLVLQERISLPTFILEMRFLKYFLLWWIKRHHKLFNKSVLVLFKCFTFTFEYSRLHQWLKVTMYIY